MARARCSSTRRGRSRRATSGPVGRGGGRRGAAARRGRAARAAGLLSGGRRQLVGELGERGAGSRGVHRPGAPAGAAAGAAGRAVPATWRASRRPATRWRGASRVRRGSRWCRWRGGGRPAIDADTGGVTPLRSGAKPARAGCLADAYAGGGVGRGRAGGVQGRRAGGVGALAGAGGRDDRGAALSDRGDEGLVSLGAAGGCRWGTGRWRWPGCAARAGTRAAGSRSWIRTERRSAWRWRAATVGCCAGRSTRRRRGSCVRSRGTRRPSSRCGPARRGDLGRALRVARRAVADPLRVGDRGGRSPAAGRRGAGRDDPRDGRRAGGGAGARARADAAGRRGFDGADQHRPARLPGGAGAGAVAVGAARGVDVHAEHRPGAARREQRAGAVRGGARDARRDGPLPGRADVGPGDR
jgi:hypothetical protein